MRRNMIFQFFASLNPNSEFCMVIEQLLEPIGLSLAETSTERIQTILSTVSLNHYLNFVSQLEVLIKQLGKLLRGAVSQLATVLISGVVKLVKMFLRGDVEEDHEENEEEEEVLQNLHQNSKKLAKSCLRKSLGLVNDIYEKFNDEAEFIGRFSDLVFEVVVGD